MKVHYARYEVDGSLIWMDICANIKTMGNHLKGYKRNTRNKISVCRFCQKQFKHFLSERGLYCSRDCSQKSGIGHRNKPHSEETKKLLSIKAKLNPKIKATQFKTGHTLWDNPNVKRHWIKKGTKPKNWQGGTRTASEKIKDDRRYKKWREAVFSRDNYTCQICGIRSQKGFGRRVLLHPHHIKSKVLYPESAYEIENGQTLCVECHIKTPNYGGNYQK